MISTLKVNDMSTIKQSLPDESDGFIDMREIHKKLDIKTKFKDWAARKTRELNEGVDYFVLTSTGKNGGRPAKHYKIAKGLYCDILKSESLLYKKSVFAQKEHGALCAIEQLMGIELERQYAVGSYRIDGYHAGSNTAYEVDESQHFVAGELKDECKERQAWIEKELGCKFVRVKV